MDITVYKDQRVNLQIIEKYRIPAVMKVKTDIITSNTGSLHLQSKNNLHKKL